MFEVVTGKAPRFTIRPHGDSNDAGWVMLVAGGMLLVPGVWLSWAGDPLTWALCLVVPVTFCTVGGLFAAKGQRITVDETRRVIELGRIELGFDEVFGLKTAAKIQVVHGQHGTNEVMKFKLEVVMRDQDYERVEYWNELLASATEPAMIDRLTSHRQIFVGLTHQLVSHGDELRVWRAAERLSKALGVPIHDFQDGKIDVREPHALDLPLEERLARRGLEEAKLSQPPETEAEVEAGCLTLRWSVAHRLPIILGLAFVPAALAGVVWAREQGMGEASWAVLAIGAAAALLGMAAGREHGPHEIEVDAKKVVHNRRFPWRRSESMPRQSVEAVRVYRSQFGYTLAFLSDDRQIRCLVPSRQTAMWMRSRIERFLVEGS